jgi:tRNA dimethylallyltransferase
VSQAPRRVAVVGPTASGKSAVAMAVAERLGDVELVSVDSMQVYRRMDIGTAKPSPLDRALVPHHLVDLIGPDESFTVADFQRAHRAALTAITGRGNRAVLVGGTGLYHRAVIDEFEIPGEWPAVRLRLEAEAAQDGPQVLHHRLAEIDPSAAAKMEPTNVRRIVRALEVCEGSGRQFSSFGPGLDTYPPSEVAQIGLRWDRAELSRRIEARVHRMIADGLVAEVAGIADTTGFSRSAAQALGYKEILDHLSGECSIDAATEQIVIRTRQFAVRQMRWFQRDPRVRWFDIESIACDISRPIEAAIDALHAR